MSYFSKQFEKHCAAYGTTPHKAALNAGVDPSKVSKAMNEKKMEEKAWESMLNGLCQNTIAPIDKETLFAWRAIDKLGPETLKKAMSYLGEITPEESLEREEIRSPKEP